MKSIKINLILGAVVLAGIALMTQNVFAMPNTGRVTKINTKSGVELTIPAHAVQVSSNVFSLGVTVDPQSGKSVQGYMIVHRKKGNAKPDGTPGGGNGKGGNGGGGGSDATSSCYGYIAKGAKWKSVESWVVDPTNPDGISDASVFSILDAGITKWEDAADGAYDDTVSVDILGAGSFSSGFATDGSLDEINGVSFAEFEEGVIGVTSIWGIFGGRPSGRELVEWDQKYNTFYDWSDTGASGAMDLDNIVTHELGHSVGMGDLYDTACSDETMYGYGTEGETKKRDLNAGDVVGISELY